VSASDTTARAIGVGKIIFSEEEMRRAISRIAHEILERNAGARDLVLVGLHTRGIPLAHRLAERINALEGIAVPPRAAAGGTRAPRTSGSGPDRRAGG